MVGVCKRREPIIYVGVDRKRGEKKKKGMVTSGEYQTQKLRRRSQRGEPTGDARLKKPAGDHRDDRVAR